MRDTLSLGICLFHSLRELHARRILHRNIKPGNVIIDTQTSLLHTTLVDIGLAHTVLGEMLSDADAVETVRYTSPEQAGAMDVDVAEPADLYSAGILLYECLTGHPPFRGHSVGNLLFEHMTVPVPRTARLAGTDPASVGRGRATAVAQGPARPLPVGRRQCWPICRRS